MGEYILILVLVFYVDRSATSQAILFPTQEACEAAKRAALAEFAPLARNAARAVCVPRHSQ